MTGTTDDVVNEVVQALTPPPKKFPWKELAAELQDQFEREKVRLELEKVRLEHQLDALRYVL